MIPETDSFIGMDSLMDSLWLCIDSSKSAALYTLIFDCFIVGGLGGGDGLPLFT